MSYMNDEEYIFRGGAISGPTAYCLLSAIKMVLNKAPNPTPEDILELEKIVSDFDKKFCDALRLAAENNDL